MKPLIAIDLGSHNLHIATGSHQKGNLDISAMGSFLLPEGAVYGDRIQNVDTIASRLVDALREMGLTTNKAIIVINAVSAFIKDVDIPSDTKAKDKEAIITNELRLNYNIQDNFVTQYKEIAKDGNNAMLASYRTVSVDEVNVENCHDVLRRARLKPLAMDVNLNALDKLLREDISINEKPLNKGATMLVDFGHHSATAYIYQAEKPLFYRHISAGAGEIERILSEETLVDLEELRHTKEEGLDLFGEEEKTRRYYQILKAYFYSINDELRNIIKFYENRYRETKVERIYLYGEGSKLVGLDSYWESALGVPVEPIRSISSVHLPESNRDPMPFINCFGALIRY